MIGATEVFITLYLSTGHKTNFDEELVNYKGDLTPENPPGDPVSHHHVENHQNRNSCITREKPFQE